VSGFLSSDEDIHVLTVLCPDAATASSGDANDPL
jgi:hypothetical protein